jgi:hypothetical protein
MQDDWHTYPFREISTLISQEESLYNSMKPKSDIVISAKPFPAKTRVVFSGAKRTITGHTKNFISIWFESKGMSAEKAEVLGEEYLFKERDRELWIPVQKNVAPDLSRYLQPGNEIIIYYFYLGGFNGKALDSKNISQDKTSISPQPDGVRWIFAVEKFDKPNTEFKLQSLSGVILFTSAKKLESLSGVILSTSAKMVEGIWYDSNNIKAKVKVEFSGKVREVTGKRKELRDLWFGKMGFPAAGDSLMRFEAQFIEGGKEYWIAIRDRTLEQLKENVRKGDSVLLNTILAGAVKDKDKIDWYFLAGEYSTF